MRQLLLALLVATALAQDAPAAGGDAPKDAPLGDGAAAKGAAVSGDAPTSGAAPLSSSSAPSSAASSGAPPKAAGENGVGWDFATIDAIVKPAIVSIERNTEVAFFGEHPGRSTATGFVVDAKRGLIMTNHHVTGSGPSFFKVSFYDGTLMDAKAVYYDPYLDFGLLSVGRPLTNLIGKELKLKGMKNTKVRVCCFAKEGWGAEGGGGGWRRVSGVNGGNGVLH
jgi:S1-C subfamily serine protease